MASRRIHTPKKRTTRKQETTDEMEKMELSKEIDDLEMTDEAKIAYVVEMEIVVELLEDSDMLDQEVVEILEMMVDLKLVDGPEMDKDVDMAEGLPI
ncbi:major facilitator-type transporter ecdD [Physcia stellaris]|nr:major facilitator-type transporter ecdD [Physcia stellaris]